MFYTILYELVILCPFLRIGQKVCLGPVGQWLTNTSFQWDGHGVLNWSSSICKLVVGVKNGFIPIKKSPSLSLSLYPCTAILNPFPFNCVEIQLELALFFWAADLGGVGLFFLFANKSCASTLIFYFTVSISGLGSSQKAHVISAPKSVCQLVGRGRMRVTVMGPCQYSIKACAHLVVFPFLSMYKRKSPRKRGMSMITDSLRVSRE